MGRDRDSTCKKIEKVTLVPCKYHGKDEVGAERKDQRCSFSQEGEASLKRRHLSEDRRSGWACKHLGEKVSGRVTCLVLGTKTRPESQMVGIRMEGGKAWEIGKVQIIRAL